MKIEIINQQRIKRINLKELTRLLKKISRQLAISNKKISLLICDNKLIKKLNKQYFGKFRATDVISFPLKDSLEPSYLGEVVVSAEEAVKVSKKLKVRWQDELLLYCLHGILHLIGYSDTTKSKRAKMERKQQKVIKALLGKNG